MRMLGNSLEKTSLDTAAGPTWGPVGLPRRMVARMVNRTACWRTQKAFAAGLKPILVVNKIDRPGAEPYRVIDEVFDLFDSLGATDEQLDFPIVYASALLGHAGLEPDEQSEDMTPLQLNPKFTGLI